MFVDGANLSLGDLHFSQGDGEITFCGAIEMAGWVHMKVSLIKGGMAKYGIKNPIFKPSPITPQYNDYLIFEEFVPARQAEHSTDLLPASATYTCSECGTFNAHAVPPSWRPPQWFWYS